MNTKRTQPRRREGGKKIESSINEKQFGVIGRS